VYSGVHFLKGNELVSVLTFALTLSNFPAVRKHLHFAETAGSDWFSETPVHNQSHRPTDHPHGQMLTFHGELAFLLRTFFFVLLGTLVDYAGLRQNILLALLCFTAIFLARGVAVQTGRLAWNTFSALERERMVRFIPRGLITAVLGIGVFEARGNEFAFLPSLAFGVVVLTNLVLLVGVVRARNLPASEPATVQAIAFSGPAR
jgi:hypothetical protein